MQHIKAACALLSALLIPALSAGLLVACGSAGGPTGANSATNSGSRRPNVLVILADDLGYSDLGTFGSEIATPNLDRLAHEGRILTNFHSTSLCATSRAEILTGVDHHLVGMGTLPEMDQFYSASDAYSGNLNTAAPTLAELLHDAGYHTYMAGKWHLGGGGPPNFGFDQSFYLNPESANGNNFSPVAGAASTSEPYFENGTQAVLPDNFFSSDYFTQKVEQYIDAGRGDGRPFFAYLAFQAVHFPIQVPDAYLNLYKGQYDVGYQVIRDARIARQKTLGILPQDFTANPGDEATMARYGSPGSETNTAWDLLTDSDRQSEARIMEILAGMITNMDDNIGQLFDHLRQIGEYDNTFIVFLSDNGADGVGTSPSGTPTTSTDLDNSLANYGRPGSYIFRSTRWAEAGTAPLRLFKAFTAEGGISVPAIVQLPNGTAQPISDALSSVLDVVPTALAVAGVESPGGVYQGQAVALLEGASLLPVLQGVRPQVHDDNEVLIDEVNDIRYVRRGPWKMTRFVNYLVPPAAVLLSHDWQLFRMDTDRGETTDLASANPDIVAQLTAEWKRYVTRVGVQQPTIPPILTPIDQ